MIKKPLKKTETQTAPPSSPPSLPHSVNATATAPIQSLQEEIPPLRGSGGVVAAAVAAARTKRARQRIHYLPDDPDIGTPLFADDEDDVGRATPSSFLCNVSLMSSSSSCALGTNSSLGGPLKTNRSYQSCNKQNDFIDNSEHRQHDAEDEEELISGNMCGAPHTPQTSKVQTNFDEEEEEELLLPDIATDGELWGESARVAELASLIKSSQRPTPLQLSDHFCSPSRSIYIDLSHLSSSSSHKKTAKSQEEEELDEMGSSRYSLNEKIRRLSPLHTLTQQQLASLPLGTQAFVNAVNSGSNSTSATAQTMAASMSTPSSSTTGRFRNPEENRSIPTTTASRISSRRSDGSGIRLSFDDGVIFGGSSQNQNPLVPFSLHPTPWQQQLHREEGIENEHEALSTTTAFPHLSATLPTTINQVHVESAPDTPSLQQQNSLRRLIRKYKNVSFIDFLGTPHPNPFSIGEIGKTSSQQKKKDEKPNDNNKCLQVTPSTPTRPSTNFPPNFSLDSTKSLPQPPMLWCPWSCLSETPLTLCGWGLPDTVTTSYASMGITALHPWQRACLFEYLQQLQYHDNYVWLKTPSGKRWLTITNSAKQSKEASASPPSTCLLYSARTGGGKTLVSEMIMFRTLLRNEQSFLISSSSKIENFYKRESGMQFQFIEYVQRDLVKFTKALSSLSELQLSELVDDGSDGDTPSSDFSSSSSDCDEEDDSSTKVGQRLKGQSIRGGEEEALKTSSPQGPQLSNITTISSSATTTQNTNSQGNNNPALDHTLGTKVMFIVPYVAIAEEKSAVFTKVAAAIGKKVRCHARNKGQRSLSDDIHVCTIEKANVLINLFLERGRSSELGLVVVDEIHQVRDAERGYILELLLTKLVELSSIATSSSSPEQPSIESPSPQKKVIDECGGSTINKTNAEKDDDDTELQALVHRHAQKQEQRVSEQRRLMLVGMSATLSNAPSLAKWMNNALFFATDYRPVPLTERFALNHQVFRPPLSNPSSSTTTTYATNLPERVLDGTAFLTLWNTTDNDNNSVNVDSANDELPRSSSSVPHSFTVWKNILLDYFQRGADISSIKLPMTQQSTLQHPSLLLPQKGGTGSYSSGSSNKWFLEQRAIDRDLQHLALEGCYQGFQLLVFCPSRVSCEQTALQLSEGAAFLFGADPRRWGDSNGNLVVEEVNDGDDTTVATIPLSPSRPHPQVIASISKRIELVKSLRALAVGDYGKIKLSLSYPPPSAQQPLDSSHFVSLKLVNADGEQQPATTTVTPVYQQQQQQGVNSTAASISSAAATITKNLYLSIINFGVAFHHAGLTSEQRQLIEDAFRNRIVWVICCTTTLATGVNLPARRVIFKTIKIANQAIDSTRYHQAAGRAGRQGYDTSGEVYVLGRVVERTAILKVMSPVLPPLESNFSSQKRGMVRVLLEGFSTKTIKSVFDIKHCVERTLLAAADSPSALSTSTTLASCEGPPPVVAPPPSTNLEEVFSATKNALDFLEGSRFISWDPSHEIFVTTALGEATVASSLAPDEALLLYEDLSHARSSICLENDLHLLFLCTPYYHGLEPEWSRFLSEFLNGGALGIPDASVRHVMSLIGVDFGFLHQCSIIPPPRGTGILTLGEIATAASNNKPTANNPATQKRLLLLHRRLYLTLVLWDVINEVPPSTISRKFGSNVRTGELRRLRELASTFSNMAANFCDKLNWWQLPPLLERIATRLSKGVEADLLPLMTIDGLTPSRARELAKKGFRTPLAVASASISELESILSDSVQFAGAATMQGRNEYPNNTSAQQQNANIEGNSHSHENGRGEYLSKLCNSHLQETMAINRSGLTKRNLARHLIEGARSALLLEASELAESLQNIPSMTGGALDTGASPSSILSLNILGSGNSGGPSNTFIPQVWGNVASPLSSVPYIFNGSSSALTSASSPSLLLLEGDSVTSDSPTWVGIDAKNPTQWEKFLLCISLVRSISATEETSSSCWPVGSASEWISHGPYIALVVVAPQTTLEHPKDLVFCVQGKFVSKGEGNITYVAENRTSSHQPPMTLFYVQNASSTSVIEIEDKPTEKNEDSRSNSGPLPSPPKTRHIPCEATSSFLSLEFFPSKRFAKILPDSKVSILQLRAAGMIPRSTGMYPSMFFSSGCGPIIDPYIADWLLSPEDRSPYRSPPIGQLCASHGVVPLTSPARLDTNLATWLLSTRQAPTHITGQTHQPTVAKALRNYVKHISNRRTITTLQLNCSVAVLAFEVTKALLRKLDSLSKPSTKENMTPTNFECQVRCLVQLEMPTMLCLVQMECHGIGFDHVYFESLVHLMDRRRIEIEEEAYKAVGGVSNWDLASPKDCARILYDVMQMPSLERTFESKYLPKRLHGSAAKGRGRGAKIMRETRSTKQSVLKALQRMFPENTLPGLIMEHRTMVGWSEKYLHAILHLSKLSLKPSSVIISPSFRFRRIHGTFLQTSTATGRLTMEDPNLQTIPHPITFQFTHPPRDTIDVALRRAFTARPYHLSPRSTNTNSTTTHLVACSICGQPSDPQTSSPLGSASSCSPPPGDYSILSVDYGQIEARLLAHFSGDEKLLSVFRRCSAGENASLDIFEELARQIQERTVNPTKKSNSRSKDAPDEELQNNTNEVALRSVNNRENPLSRRSGHTHEPENQEPSHSPLGQKRSRAEEQDSATVTRVTPDQRKAAKTLCYGMIYGKGANAIAEDLDLEIDEAKDLLATFRATYKTATSFIESVGNSSSSGGFVQTITGRKRWLPYAGSNNQRRKSASDRISINTLCQGSAADVMKLAMINLVSLPPPQPLSDLSPNHGRVVCSICLKEGQVSHHDLLFGNHPPAQLILQIHDELLFEVCTAFIPSLSRVLRSVMDVSKVFNLQVPLDVRITAGPNYEDMNPVE